MTTSLYLTEQGSVLRKAGQRLIVDKNDEELLEIECFKVDTIFVFGNVQVTAQALTQVLAHNIELSLLTQRGRLKGQITPPMPKNVILRKAQNRVEQDEAASLALAKTIVAGKIASSRRFLDRHRRNKPEAGFEEFVDQLSDDLEQVRGAPSLASLLGREGDSARAYFQGLALACTGMPFTGRKRRPPPDPVNALLSFGYTLVGSEIRSILDAMGFDPYMGILHQLRYGRPSLALDLLEEFRVDAVDRLVLGLVNRKVLTPKHFYDDPEGKGMRLTQKGAKIFFAAYDKHMTSEFACQGPLRRTTLRQAFRFQAERLAKTLGTGQPYAAFQRR